MTYQLLALDADTNEWRLITHGDNYAELNARVHRMEQDGEVYAIQHIATGCWV